MIADTGAVNRGEQAKDRGIDWMARYQDLVSQIGDMVAMVEKKYNSCLENSDTVSGARSVIIEDIEFTLTPEALIVTTVAGGSDLEYALYEYSGEEKVKTRPYQRSNSFKIPMIARQVDRVRVFVRCRSKHDQMETQSIDLDGVV